MIRIKRSDFKLPRKGPRSHKAQFGKLGVIGGKASMPGAAMLAAEAGGRMGAGYSSLFLSESSETLKLDIKNASFIFHSRWKMSDLEKQTALVIGCGGKPPSSFKISKLKCPIVIDASA